MSSWDPIATIAADVRAQKKTALELVERSLHAIDEQKSFQAIISTCKERALSRAKEIDARIQKGDDPGRLAGVPFIAKDNFLTFGSETTAASNILRGFNAPYQSEAIDRLESEGAICVAKANLDAFAHGSSTENSDWFTTKNPHDETRVPGGSSGGSATAVALQLAPFALGTDTGGSIRQPASFCGVVGYKPTYGLVSRSGVIAMASSTDVIGPLASSVEDAGYVLDCMAGVDAKDSTTIEREVSSYAELEDIPLKGKKIGVVREYLTDDVDDEVRDAIEATIAQAKNSGAEIVDISLPSLSLALGVYYILCPAEISSNLARYDGQRFGYSDPSAQTLEESFNGSRSIGFGHEAKRRIMIGTYVLSSGYYDAFYKRAQQIRTKLIQEFEAAFESCDVLVGPTTPSKAFKIGENTEDPMKMYLSDIMTVAVNLVGIPGISIPVPSSGLPIGVQIMAPQRQDKKLLEVAKALEKELAS